MFKSIQKVSLRSTINHIVCDFNVDEQQQQQQVQQPDDDQCDWTDLVYKCIEGRQLRMMAQLPEISISESENSMVPPAEMFSLEAETGRDGHFSSTGDQIILMDDVIPTPKSSRRKSAVPTTVIEELVETPTRRKSRRSTTIDRSKRSSAASPFSSSIDTTLDAAVASFDATITGSANESIRSRAKTIRNSSNHSTPNVPMNSSNRSTPKVPINSTNHSTPNVPMNSSNRSVLKGANSSSNRSTPNASLMSSNHSVLKVVNNSLNHSTPNSPVNSSTRPLESPPRSPTTSSVGSPVSYSPAASPPRSPINSPINSPIKPSHSSVQAKKPKGRKQIESDPAEIRQESKRAHLRRNLQGKRLQTWRGEHPIYRPLENGCYECVDITKAHTPDHLKRKRAHSKRIVKKDIKRQNLEPVLTETFVEKSKSVKDRLADIFLEKESLYWKKLKSSEFIEYTTLTRNKETNQVVGYFRFLDRCTKPPQKSGFIATYILVKGSVSFQIGDEPSVLVKELDPVIIPASTTYSIENLISSESILLFTLT